MGFATFKLPQTMAAGQFGLVVLSSGAEEYTAVAFDRMRRHILLDRSKSGAPGLQGDDDVRAGPWLSDSPDILTMHAYVDNQIVSLIANNQTAISAWVDPTKEASCKVGLFAESSSGEGVELLSLDIWHLARDSFASGPMNGILV